MTMTTTSNGADRGTEALPSIPPPHPGSGW